MIYCIKKEFLHNYRDQLSVFFILSISVFFSLRYKTMDFRIILYIVHSLTSVCSVYIHPHNISQWLLSISSRSHNQSLAFIIFPAIPTTLHYRIIIFINLKHRPTLRDVIFQEYFYNNLTFLRKKSKSASDWNFICYVSFSFRLISFGLIVANVLLNGF